MRDQKQWNDFKTMIRNENPDIIGLQEVKLPAEGPSGCKKGDGQPRQRGTLKRSDKTSANESAEIDNKWREEPFSAYRVVYSLSDWKYSGVALLVKRERPFSLSNATEIAFTLSRPGPLQDPFSGPMVKRSKTDQSQHHHEGRVVQMLVPTGDGTVLRVLNLYTPNIGFGSNARPRRMVWDDTLRSYCEELLDAKRDGQSPTIATKEKSSIEGIMERVPTSLTTDGSSIVPVSQDPAILIMGDLNVAPNDVDLSHPSWFKEQVVDAGCPKDYVGQPGCQPIEIEKFEDLLSIGFVDQYRALNPCSSPPAVESSGYTWRGHAGQNLTGKYYGKGMRIDHVLTTPNVKVASVKVLSSGKDMTGCMGSDHAPVLIRLHPVSRSNVDHQDSSA